MSEEGENIVKVIKEIKKFSKQIALLLQTVDEDMRKEGWEADSNTVMADTSSSLSSPEKWFPNCIFRFYKNNESKNILAYSSILLDDDIWGEYKITEPLITAGYFEYDQNKEIGYNDWYYWFAKWFRYMEKRKVDGRIKSYKNWKDDLKKAWGKDYEKIGSIEHWNCFGLPLTSITNSQDIQTKIITPLLDILSKK